ncbi:hypothetical protein [Candidatus Methanoprimaticola sp. MG2]|uniref:hypothetical protein n=1 Tax=Candidatus Methanoprimaticola sp. MG2 TaxID=3228838 RepID=UPI0039C76108
MSSRPSGYKGFWNSKLSAQENRIINDRIKQSWKNGRESGRKAAFASLYSRGILKSSR